MGLFFIGNAELMHFGFRSYMICGVLRQYVWRCCIVMCNLSVEVISLPSFVHRYDFSNRNDRKFLVPKNIFG